MPAHASPRFSPPSLVRMVGVALSLLLALGGPGCSSSEPEPPPEPVIDRERSSLTVDRTTGVAADGQDAVVGTVRVRDTTGAAMPRVNVFIVVRQGLNEQVFEIPATNDVGTSRFQLVSSVVATLTLEAVVERRDQQVRLKERPTVEFVVGRPQRLVILEGPSAAVAGEELDTLEVGAMDASGNPVKEPFSVTLALASGSTASRLEGTLTATAERRAGRDGPTAVFQGLRVLGAGVASLAVSSPEVVEEALTSFSVNPGPPAQLLLEAPFSGEVLAGVPLDPPPAVRVADRHGNVVSDGAGMVELLLEDARGGRYAVARSEVFDAPPFRFPNVRVHRAGADYRLVARSLFLGVPEVRGAPFTVRVGAPSAAVSSLRATPGRLPAGESSRATVRVQLLDAGGNPVVDSPVRLAVSGTGHTLVPESGEGRTDAQGAFTATLSSTTPQVVRVTTTAGGHDLHTEVAFVEACSATTALPFLPVLGDVASEGTLLPVDLDGDGDLDVVSSEGILYDNTGDGTLVQRTADPERAPGPFAVGDLDGDGAPELLVTGERVVVRFNRGDGGFFPPWTLAWWSGNASSRWVADINGDGRNDVVYLASGSTGAEAHVLLNQGGGLLAPAVSTPLGEGVAASPQAVLVSRGPGEGADLVVLANSGMGARIFQADAEGRFARGADHSLPVFSYRLSTGDVDGDGREDFFAHSGGAGGLSLLRNLGQGTFAAAVHIDLGALVNTLAVADLDGDGRRDLAFSGDGTLWLARQGEDGGFLPKAAAGLSNFAGSVAAGDLTGDGRPELLVSSAGGLLPLINRGDGTFRTQRRLLRPSRPSRLVLGDFNGDGVTDAAALDTFMDFLLSQPEGAWAEQRIRAPGVERTDAVATDLDGDGRTDLVISDAVDLKLQVMRATDSGISAESSYITLNAPGALAAGDLDGDGAPDVVVLHPQMDFASIYRNNGTGLLLPPVRLTVRSLARALALSDLDGDGDLDLVVALAPSEGEGVVLRFDNEGQGTLALQSERTVDRGPEALAVGDLDGDARPEVVTANRGDDTVTVLSGAGAPARTLRVGKAPRYLALGDFNRDGRPDIAVANEQSARMGLLPGQVGGGFSAHQWQAGMLSPRSLVAHDWNRDGQVDLLASYEDGVDLIQATCVR